MCIIQEDAAVRSYHERENSSLCRATAGTATATVRKPQGGGKQGRVLRDVHDARESSYRVVGDDMGGGKQRTTG